MLSLSMVDACLSRFPPFFSTDLRHYFLYLASEQKAALSLLNTWQLARPNRAAITLGGDLHLGGFTDSWVSRSRLF